MKSFIYKNGLSEIYRDYLFLLISERKVSVLELCDRIRYGVYFLVQCVVFGEI
jgi:hypothetical protein